MTRGCTEALWWVFRFDVNLKVICNNPISLHYNDIRIYFRNVGVRVGGDFDRVAADIYINL